MQIYKRVQLKKRELLQLKRDCEGYIWIAIDPVNSSISLGDDYLADLRDCLLVKRSSPGNVFGIGFDMSTGRIDYVAQINRRNPTVGCSGELSEEDKAKVEKTLHYFFEKLPAFRHGDNEDSNLFDDLSDASIAFY